MAAVESEAGCITVKSRAHGWTQALVGCLINELPKPGVGALSDPGLAIWSTDRGAWRRGCSADTILSGVLTLVFSSLKLTADNEASLAPQLHQEPQIYIHFWTSSAFRNVYGECFFRWKMYQTWTERNGYISLLVNKQNWGLQLKLIFLLFSVLHFKRVLDWCSDATLAFGECLVIQSQSLRYSV